LFFMISRTGTLLSEWWVGWLFTDGVNNRTIVSHGCFQR
jgi:hypothetical protein